AERAEHDGQGERGPGRAAVVLAEVADVAQVVLDLPRRRLSRARAEVVDGARVGAEGHAEPGGAEAPAEVRLLEVHPEAFVEATDAGEGVAADQHHRPRHAVYRRVAREVAVRVVEPPDPAVLRQERVDAEE